MNRVEPRELWNARPATSKHRPLDYRNLTGWSVHWLGQPYPADMTDHQIMQAIQREHMVGRAERGLQPFSDIGYNLVIGRQGLTLEARGDQWEGAHTKAHNHRYLGLCFAIGQGQLPTQRMLEQAEWLIKSYVPRGVPPVVHPHSANVPTECPGDSIRLWAAQFTKHVARVTLDPAPPSLLGDDDMTPAQREAVGRIQQAVNSTNYRPPLVVDQDPGTKTAAAVEAMASRVDPLNIVGRARQLIQDLLKGSP